MTTETLWGQTVSRFKGSKVHKKPVDPGAALKQPPLFSFFHISFQMCQGINVRVQTRVNSCNFLNLLKKLFFKIKGCSSQTSTLKKIPSPDSQNSCSCCLKAVFNSTVHMKCGDRLDFYSSTQRRSALLTCFALRSNPVVAQLSGKSFSSHHAKRSNPPAKNSQSGGCKTSDRSL